MTHPPSLRRARRAPLPDGMAKAAARLRETGSKEECLRRAYDLLTAKYHGGKLSTYVRLPALLTTDLGKLWAKEGFLHCTKMNSLLRILLVESGWFEEENVSARWTLIWYVSPHQYLQVRVGERKPIDVDMWGKTYGVPFGKFAHGPV